MYTAMINKDRAALERVHDDSFMLVHVAVTASVSACEN